MEALEEAVVGTAGCILSGALRLTMATLLLFTCSLRLASATMLGVLVVLVAFVGYLTQRGYSLGVAEAVATTIFIGFACDYCVHVLSVAEHTHRAHGAQHGEGSVAEARLPLAETLSRAAPSLYGAALTTIAAAAPLLFCRVLLFQQMGEFICVCTTISLLCALTLIAPLAHARSRAVAAYPLRAAPPPALATASPAPPPKDAPGTDTAVTLVRAASPSEVRVTADFPLFPSDFVLNPRTRSRHPSSSPPVSAGMGRRFSDVI